MRRFRVYIHVILISKSLCPLAIAERESEPGGAGRQERPPPLTVAVQQLEFIVDAVVGFLVVGLLKVTINNCI